MNKKNKTLNNNSELLCFLIYAFAIPLICVGIIKFIPAFQSGLPYLVLFGIEATAPAIAAILVKLQHGGLNGLKNFLREKYLNHFSLKYCCIALLVPAVVLTIAKLITYLTPYNNEFITLPSSKKLLIICWTLITEELGWRGFLQDKINAFFSNKLTPLIVGVIWGFWHYHFWLLTSLDFPLWAFIFGSIAESYGYYTLTRKADGNVIPAYIWHFSGNLFCNLYLFNPKWNNGNILPFVIINMIYIVYIFIFLYYQKKSEFNKL